MKKYLFVSCTRHGSQEQTHLGRAFARQGADALANVELRMLYENRLPLTVAYNQFLTEQYRGRIVVFVHDDVTLHFGSAVYELARALEHFAVVGVAGASTARLKKPALWHLMSDPSRHSGAVAHPIAPGSDLVIMTSAGAYPQRCLLLDGVMLAVDIDRVLDAGVRFDQANPCMAHFYDLDFCLSAYHAKLPIGTWGIYLVHQSRGLAAETPDWLAGQEWFLSKWTARVNSPGAPSAGAGEKWFT